MSNIVITLTPEQVAAVLAQAGSTLTTPPPPVIDIPANVVVVDVPWAIRVGTFTVTLFPGQTKAFGFVPQDTNFNTASFSVSPSDDKSYFDREVCLSEAPGAFEGLVRGDGRIYFTAGASFPKDKYGRFDTRYPCLNPGQKYYVNVRQKDPTLTCRVNYSLMPA